MRLFNRCLFYWVFINNTDVQSKTGHLILCFYLLTFWFFKKPLVTWIVFLLSWGFILHFLSFFFFFALEGFLILHHTLKPLFLDV